MTISPVLLRAKLAGIEKIAAKQKRDFLVVMGSQSLGILMHALSGYRVYVYVHGLADFYAAHGKYGQSLGKSSAFESRANLAGCLPAEGFLVPSQSVMRELEPLALNISKRASVISLPVSPPVIGESEIVSSINNVWRQQGVIPPNYILHCGSSNWNENRISLVYLCSHLKKSRPNAPALVWAGEEPSQEEEALIKSTGITFYHFRSPTQQDYEALIRGARCLADVPLASSEALFATQAVAIGTPLIITQVDSLLERLSEAAAASIPVFQPEQVEAWSQEVSVAITALLDATEEERLLWTQEAMKHVDRLTTQRFQKDLIAALKL
jgi:hypothetical protein